MKNWQSRERNTDSATLDSLSDSTGVTQEVSHNLNSFPCEFCIRFTRDRFLYAVSTRTEVPPSCKASRLNHVIKLTINLTLRL